MRNRIALILSVVVFFGCVKALAQITIFANQVAGLGDTAFYSNRVKGPNDSLWSVGSAGAMQTYDFRVVPFDSSNSFSLLDKEFYTNPVTTPYFNLFPTANLCDSVGGQFAYISKSSSLIEFLGFVIGVPDTVIPGIPTSLVLKPTSPLTFLSMPFTYNSTFTDNTTFKVAFPFDTTIVYSGVSVNVDSVRISLPVNTSSTIDGYGTLIAPDSAEHQVLRQRFEISSGTVGLEVRAQLPFFGFAWIPFPIPIDIPSFNQISYNYWSTTARFPILTAEMDTLGTNILSVRYQRKPVVSQLKQIANTDILVYPQPATNEVNIVGAHNGHYYLYNVSGKMVQSGRIYLDKQTIALTDLTNGLYLLNIEQKNKATRQLKLIINRY